MSIQSSIATLQTLQVLDSKIGKLEEKLANEKTGMDDKAERHVVLMSQLERLQKVISQMEGTKGELQQELRQTSVHVDKTREKLTRCRNEREANAAQRELEEIRRMYKEREAEIQKLTGLIDDARTDLGQVQAECDEIGSQIDATGGETAEAVRTLSRELEQLVSKRRESLERLATSTRRKYEAVSKLRGTGAAAVFEGCCTACNISISPMLYQEIMRQTEIHQCPSCHRLLYHSETAPGLPRRGGASEDNDAPGPDSDAAATSG